MSSLFDALALRCRRLTLTDYRCDLHIGVYEHEHGHTQPVIFCADVWVLNTPLASDTLEATYDYGHIERAIRHAAKNAHTQLQETVLERIMDELLAHPAVEAVRLSSRKPEAYPCAASAGVEIFRLRPDTSIPHV